MNDIEKLLELQRRTGGLSLPYTNAMTVYVALYVNEDLPTAALHVIKAQRVWDNDLYRNVKSRLMKLKESLIIDVEMALELARKIFIMRCEVATNPFMALSELNHYEDYRELDKRLPEHVANRVWFYITDTMHEYRNQYAALMLQDKKIEASNKLAQEMIDSTYNNFVDKVQDIPSGYYPLVLDLISAIYSRLINSIHVIGHPEYFYSMNTEYSHRAAMFIFKHLYNNVEIAAILTERLLNIDGYVEQYIDPKNIYASPTYLSMESVESFDEIDRLFLETDMAIEHFQSTVKGWGFKTITPADLQLLNKMFPDLIAENHIDLDQAISMEGLIGSISKGIKAAVKALIKFIVDILNGILRYLGRPFGIEPKFILTESGDLIETWGVRYNRPIHDYIESNPAWLMLPANMLEMSRTIKGIAQDIEDLVVTSNRAMSGYLSSGNDNTAVTEMREYATRIVEIRKRFELVAGDYKIMEGQVDFTFDYKEPALGDFANAPNVGITTARSIVAAFKALNTTSVKRRMTGEAEIRRVMTYPKREEYEAVAEKITLIVDDMRKMTKEIDTRTSVLDAFTPSLSNPKSASLEKTQEAYNLFYKYSVSLLANLAQATGMYLTLYTDCYRLAIEMKLTAEANLLN